MESRPRVRKGNLVLPPPPPPPPPPPHDAPQLGVELASVCQQHPDGVNNAWGERRGVHMSLERPAAAAPRMARCTAARGGPALPRPAGPRTRDPAQDCEQQVYPERGCSRWTVEHVWRGSGADRRPDGRARPRQHAGGWCGLNSRPPLHRRLPHSRSPAVRPGSPLSRFSLMKTERGWRGRQAAESGDQGSQPADPSARSRQSARPPASSRHVLPAAHPPAAAGRWPQ